MMGAIPENNWVGMNMSQLPPISEVFGKINIGKDITHYNTMAFTPSLEDYLFGGGEVHEALQFNDTPLHYYHPNSTMEGSIGNQSSQNPVMFTNYGDEPAEYIFDRSDVRAIFLVLYTIVFCSCFFGNLMVILVVTLHWRMRSITNFFLANLAFADLCVGIFCVYQNIVTYLMDSWIFGEFMCKMYHFINCLSTTASVLILVVICIERYLAIIHPMTCKQMLTLNRLRITIVFVWILSAAISSPRFYYFNTIRIPLGNDQYEILCLPNRTKFNSKLMDMLSMTGLFLIPLTIITILYTHIGIVLWKSSNNRMPAATPTPSVDSSSSSGDYYRETLDHNIIQTVNLTLLPLSSQQILLQQQTQPNRPGLLQGMGSSSCSQMIAQTSGGAQVDKRSSSSFLPSHFICGKKSRKQKKHIKKPRRHCNAAQTPSFEGRVCANCMRNIQMNGNLAADGETSGRLTATNGELGVGQEFIMNCKACQKPYMHQPHFSINPGINCLPLSERIETTSFIQTCCQMYHKNNSCARHPNADETDSLRTVDDAVGSPNKTTCCTVRSRPTNICFRKQSSQNKSFTFTTSPPSPYFNKNCSCLDGKCSKTEPIVLVKFEKNDKKSNKKIRKSQCTILMNTNSCQRAGTSSAVPFSGNRSKPCSQGGTSFDADTDGDSPRTVSPSLSRLGCTICHCHEQNMEYCGGNASVGDHHAGITGNETLRGLHNHYQHHQSSCHRNCSLSHTINLSVDSGISSTGRTNIDGGCALEGICAASCPSCGVSCVESFYQWYRCPHHNPNQPFPSPSPKFPPYAVPNSTSHSIATTPSASKRVRRMRITRSNKYGTSALRARRRIIRMLIVVVLAFALCHLPFHARKVWQYWSPTWAPYQAGSVFSTLLTPITFLIMYANSAINPILYAFMSKKFRMSFRDLLCCRMRHSLRISRNASVRSTHAVALSQAGL